MKSEKPALQILIVFAFALLGCASASATGSHARSERHSLNHDGIERTYSIYLPAGVNGARPLPLLMALHGGGGSAKAWPRYTNNGFERLADREHFILVYPEGLEGHWNDGRGVARFYAQREAIDDSGFLAHLINELQTSYPVDSNRIYVAGASNGGMMAHRLAAEHSDKLAAIAAVISAIPSRLENKLDPTDPVSVLVMNGTEDPLVRWEGGPISFGRKVNGSVISTDRTVEFWTGQNRCIAPPRTTSLPDEDPNDGTRVTRTNYGNCQSGSEVALYKIIGGGHTWPARQDKRGLFGKLLIDKVVGRKSRDIEACEIIWQFFKQHPKRDSPKF